MKKLKLTNYVYSIPEELDEDALNLALLYGSSTLSILNVIENNPKLKRQYYSSISKIKKTMIDSDIKKLIYEVLPIVKERYDFYNELVNLFYISYKNLSELVSEFIETNFEEVDSFLEWVYEGEKNTFYEQSPKHIQDFLERVYDINRDQINLSVILTICRMEKKEPFPSFLKAIYQDARFAQRFYNLTGYYVQAKLFEEQVMPKTEEPPHKIKKQIIDLLEKLEEPLINEKQIEALTATLEELKNGQVETDKKISYLEKLNKKQQREKSIFEKDINIGKKKLADAYVEIDELRKSGEELITKNQQLEQKVNSLSSEKQKMDRLKNKLENDHLKQINTLNERLRNTELELGEVNDSHSKLQNMWDMLVTEKRDLENNIAEVENSEKRYRNLYKETETKLREILIKDTNYTDELKRLKQIEQLYHQQAEMIHSLQKLSGDVVKPVVQAISPEKSRIIGYDDITPIPTGTGMISNASANKDSSRLKNLRNVNRPK